MIHVSDYVITPNDIAHAFRWRYVVGVIVAIGLSYGLTIAGASLDIAMFVGVIVASVVWKMDARVPFGAAILCFIAIMAASVLAPDAASGQGSLREQLAVTAFYCLVIGVALLIREQFAPRRNNKKATAKPQSEAITPAAAASQNTIPVAADNMQTAHTAQTARSVIYPQPPRPTTPPAIAPRTSFKPHLAPHPMLERAGRTRVSPAPVGHTVQNNKPMPIPEAVRPKAPGSRIINDVMRPAPSTQLRQGHKPYRPTPKLIQL